MSILRLAALSAVLALTACNTSGGGTTSTASPAVSGQGQGQQVAALSESDPGPGQCGADITAYRRVMKQDIEIKMVARAVYDEITADIERAAAACRAGRGGEARSMIASTKARHGYR